MEKETYVPIREISNRLGMDTSNARKYILKHGFSPVKVRTRASKNQLTIALTEEEVEQLVEIRQGEGFSTGGLVQAVAGSDKGVFYIIQLVPEALPNRLKLGFSSNIEARIQAHRTTAPTLKLLGTWVCMKTWERAAIASITRDKCKNLTDEVYDFNGKYDLAIERAESFFKLMPDTI